MPAPFVKLVVSQGNWTEDKATTLLLPLERLQGCDDEGIFQLNLYVYSLENARMVKTVLCELSCSCLDLFCAMSCCLPTKWCIGQPHDRRVSACARVHVHVLQFTFHPPQYNSIDKGKVNLKLETEKTFETYKMVNHLLCLVKLISLRIII